MRTSPAPAPLPPDPRSLFARIRGAISVGSGLLLAAWGVGQCARDIVWVTGLCFYIPSVIVVAVLVATGALHAVARRKRPALLAIGFALPPLAFVALIENHPERDSSGSAHQFRVVHWNVAGRPGRPGISEHLEAERADLYVLTDAVNASHVGVLREASAPIIRRLPSRTYR